MLSYWEKSSFTSFDYAIVGGGIVGLTTAIGIKEKEPHSTVIVLERGLLPTGASTRNAGFACFGSASELLEDIETLGEQGMIDLVSLRWEGLQILRARLGDKKIGLEENGGYELLEEDQMVYLEKLDYLNGLLGPLFKNAVYTDASGRLTGMGFDTKRITGLIYNPFEAQLDTGKMMRALWDLALDSGIHILTGSEVEQYESIPKGVKLRIKGGSPSIVFKLQARKVAFCTNAFTRQLFPEIPLYPGRGMIMMTNPVNELPFKGTFHMERGFYYFRNLGNRILIGGGRHLHIEDETTTEFGINDQIREKLLNLLRETIIPGSHFEIEHTWSGIMAFGKNKGPIVKEHKENIFLGVRLGGMGVAIGSRLGQTLSDMMTGDVSV